MAQGFSKAPGPSASACWRVLMTWQTQSFSPSDVQGSSTLRHAELPPGTAAHRHLFCPSHTQPELLPRLPGQPMPFCSGTTQTLRSDPDTSASSTLFYDLADLSWDLSSSNELTQGDNFLLLSSQSLALYYHGLKRCSMMAVKWIHEQVNR